MGSHLSRLCLFGLAVRAVSGVEGGPVRAAVDTAVAC